MTELAAPSLRPARWLTCIALLAGAALSPLHAQVQAPAEQTSHVCRVSAGDADDTGARPIYAGCWGTGLILGDADEFESFTNNALEATLAVLEHNGRTRVLLLRQTVGGLPMVEDLGSVLAASSGRGPLGTIEGLSLDYSQFESSGMIAVSDGNADEQGEGQARGHATSALSQAAESGDPPGVSPGQIDIGALIQNDPAGAPEQSAQ
ncbi:MAG: hypothetical protein P0Y56_15525 [Candidatus Andeanibacterium colombiense]|uniref:Uncharacterized protein n=1 Tax=Candidatus Andeanibacterium colombiense TaxID=3121345 RepID=A0AAJ5X976_9SPHN|nr:MAG: hypothetical protein P0Y56_15525 [Sphingomonadaceae bacterium]